MIKKYYKKIKVSSLLLLSCLAQLAHADNKLPDILDYYPNCDYQIIDETNVRLSTSTVEEYNSGELAKKLILKLRTEAKAAGANAVIILTKKAKHENDSSPQGVLGNKGKYLLSFVAQLIQQCTDGQLNKNKATPYNHQGEKLASISDFSFEMKPKKFDVFFSSNSSLKRPEVTNFGVSLANGLYGVKLGTSYQQVLDTFGEPSIKLALLENELIIGYGRRHWLYFQADKLIKVRNGSSFLSMTLLNQIPQIDFFDDNVWKINNKVGYQTSLVDVQTALNIKQPLNKKDQLVVRDNSNILTLNFIVKKNSTADKGVYRLDHYSLVTNDYKQDAHLVANETSLQYRALANLYSKLQSNEDIDKKIFLGQLGEPIGKITVSRNDAVNIYNSHLLVHTQSSEVVRIQLIENNFLDNRYVSDVNQPWRLGPFSQGKTIKQLTKHFSSDAFILNDEVEMLAEKYQLSLFFSDDGQDSLLYEAEILID